MQKTQQQQQQGLSKIQASQHFTTLFQTESNSNCFQCSKKSKQWAEVKHGIFLCLNCAATYREVTKVVSVKSIGLDLWREEEIKVLEKGGNAAFKSFLETYGLVGAEPKIVLRSRAAEYYRRLLLAKVRGEEIGPAPTPQEGKQPYVADIPLTQMTTDQMLTEAKQKLEWAGNRTKYYGGLAYDKVHHKITSGQLKQDAKQLGTKISTGAKTFFSFMSSKIEQLTKKAQVSKQAASL